MNRESKSCQNCNKEFWIEPEDFDYYKKMNVLPPTWCSDCRQARRMTWRNERTMYKRKCDAPGHTEEIISIFSKDKPLKIYDQKYWWSDAYDSTAFGRDYDFSKPFFEQYRELIERIPHLGLFNGNPTNSDYANHAFNSKNCYLISAAYINENVMYSNRTTGNKDSVDLYLADKMESCYEDVNCGTSYRLFFSYGCEDCQDSWFLYDCRNCSNCFGCVGLRNKSYHIFNQPYMKENYAKKLEELNISSYSSIEKMKEKYGEMALKFPRKYSYSFKTVNSVGDNLMETKNCHYCFDILNAQDCKFITWGGFNMKDAYDSYGMGEGELLYETVDSGIQASYIRFAVVAWTGKNVNYSYNCHNCNNIFGCIGMRNMEYCILNKQYSKEEYEALMPRIIEHMNSMPYTDKTGIVYGYGEFFPSEISPFAYNETIAQEYFPLTKEEAREKGYAWKDAEAKNYSVTKKPEDLPDDIKNAGEEITGDIIGCAHGGPPAGGCDHQCATAFRITPEEFKFYKKMNLPLPRLCPNCRHYERLRQRNPLKLWHRKCQCAGAKSENGAYANIAAHQHGAGYCPNEFETSYAPERREIVYCETCYNSEVV